jgi:hypothetical protein
MKAVFTKAKVCSGLVSIALTLSMSFLSAQSASAGGGQVLPPGARPLGYSLTDMTRLLAVFTAGGNDPRLYPETPFQVLYIASSSVESVDGGIKFTGTNTFPAAPGRKLAPGTKFFVPIQNATDGPPVAGDFPNDEAGAIPYFFGPSQLGARDYEIVVDGAITPVGAGNLAGPVATPPLADGGTHIITLGVFLSPMTPGTHTVTIRGRLAGQAIGATYPFRFLAEDFTYIVTVGSS